MPLCVPSLQSRPPRVVQCLLTSHTFVTLATLDAQKIPEIRPDIHDAIKTPSLQPRIVRSIKKRNRSPLSAQLVSALKGVGQGHLISRAPVHKVDLSYVKPQVPVHAISKYLKEKILAKSHVTRGDKWTSLPTIVAESILAKGSKSLESSTTQRMLRRMRYLGYLKSRNFDAEDVNLWTYILTEEDVDSAATAIRTGSQHAITSPANASKPLPMFLLLCFLRRPHISAKGLQSILIRVWMELQRQRKPNDGTRRRVNRTGSLPRANGISYTSNDSSLFIAFVRLVRHARIVWPEALGTIAKLFGHAFVLPSTSFDATSKRHHRQMARLTFWYNRMLRLLSLPSPSQPYAALPYHQRAQFDILASMAFHSPPLTVSREGFQSIISTQVAHRKTVQEQDWSQLKAKSWPPWKEDKTGLDAGKDIDYGKSRAMQAIHRAAEAGYSPGFWAEIAHILAGQDIDRSPTIQMRDSLIHKYVNRPTFLGHPKLENVDNKSRLHLWAPRIAATRTIQEAWACFLSYQDLNLPKDTRIYSAMLIKLSAGRMNMQSEDGQGNWKSRCLEPGDYREVLPTRESPMEATYVHTDPPTAEEFALRMYKNGIAIRGKALQLLLSTAESLDQGLKYIYWGSRHDASLEGLLTDRPDRSPQLLRIPGNIYRAYLLLLCKFPSEQLSSKIETTTGTWDLSHSAFLTAMRLAKARNTAQIKPFKVILSALANRWRPITDLGESRHNAVNMMKRYVFMRTAIHASLRKGEANPHMGGFGYLCLNLLEYAVIAAIESKSSKSKTQPRWCADEDKALADSILNDSSAALQDMFYSTASPSDDADLSRPGRPNLPRLLATPSPMILHGVVRVLGFLRDYEGLLKLFEWIRIYETEISKAAEEPRNGYKLLRRAAVAARVFSERSWVRGENVNDKALLASQPVRQKLRAVIENTEVLGGWPTEEEVEMYINQARSRFPVE